MIPLTCVAVLYAGLSVYVVILDNSDTVLETIYSIELLTQDLLGYAELLKISAAFAFALALMLFLIEAAAILLPSSGFPQIAKENFSVIARFFTVYGKRVGIFYAVIFLVCSFTFFTHLYKPYSASLEVRIKQAEEDIGHLKSGVAQGLLEEIADNVLREVIDTEPEEITESRSTTSQSFYNWQKLEAEYKEAKSRFEIDSRRVESALQQNKPLGQGYFEEARKASLKPVELSELRVPAHTYDLRETTSRRIEHGLKNLDRPIGHTHYAADILNLDSRRELTSKIVGRLVQLSKLEVLQPVFEEYPLSKSVVEVFEKTLTDLVSKAVERNAFTPVIDRLTRQAQEMPDVSFNQAVEKEARSLVLKYANTETMWERYSKGRDMGLVVSATARVKKDAAELQKLTSWLQDKTKRRQQELVLRRSKLLKDLEIEFGRITKLLPVRGSLSAFADAGILNEVRSALSVMPGYRRERILRSLKQKGIPLDVRPSDIIVEGEGKAESRPERPKILEFGDRSSLKKLYNPEGEHDLKKILEDRQLRIESLPDWLVLFKLEGSIPRSKLYRTEAEIYVQEVLSELREAEVSADQVRHMEAMIKLTAGFGTGLAMFKRIESFAGEYLSLRPAMRRITPETEQAFNKYKASRNRIGRLPSPYSQYRPRPRTVRR